jgi:hypothetical protein
VAETGWLLTVKLTVPPFVKLAPCTVIVEPGAAPPVLVIEIAGGEACDDWETMRVTIMPAIITTETAA